MTENVPDNTYIVMACERPRTCEECGNATTTLLVANEVAFKDGDIGIEAVVRYDGCGHVCPDADADPITIAILSEFFESQPDEDFDWIEDDQ